MHNHFDEQAATWDEDQSKVDRARTVAEALVGAVPLRGDERLLEYGAGTGLVAQALADTVGTITLADSSAGMREAMAKKIGAGVLPSTARIWDLDLTSDDVPRERFDVIVSSLVLHHIKDLPRVLAGFHELLERGGHVAIADLDQEDGSFHEHVHDFDGHNGFDRAQLQSDLLAAGFENVRFAEAGEVQKEGRAFGLFLATAVKP
ncbi:class I SAM-dependent DNA methyltransferase [Tessaracoccus oleiagri]|uniref:Methyltransferase domain-containing protein n=1 Tax=Tessaracoccus oleiagri TaxID=686624 RepID=A0A1G9MHV2_9ACTN|nr:class I SAM-dependent methyltransferase [Tessaracoccus oleiagri]SDL73724.1 Methyltransferase domain-containing protein [Tessaracoccus oleiagri]